MKARLPKRLMHQNYMFLYAYMAKNSTYFFSNHLRHIGMEARSPKRPMNKKLYALLCLYGKKLNVKFVLTI